MHSLHVCIEHAQCRLENDLSDTKASGFGFLGSIWAVIVSVPGLCILCSFICYMHSLDSAKII